MARVEYRPDDRDNLLGRLAAMVMEVGPMVGAHLNINPPEALISVLYLVCSAKLYRFDPNKSLRGWVTAYARRVGMEVLREQRLLGSELLEDPCDRSFHEDITSVFDRDAATVLEDEQTELAEVHLERQRPKWPSKRSIIWTETLQAAWDRNRHETRTGAGKAAFLDILIRSSTPQLVVPWNVLVRDADRNMLAAELGVTRGAIDQRVSRFQRDVRGKLEELAVVVRATTGYSFN